MLVGIHTNSSFGSSGMLLRYEQILDFNRIPHVRLDSNQPDFWDKVAKLDLFIFHWIGTTRNHQQAPTILGIVERELGVKCFPNHRTCWAYDDKIREHYLLRQHGFPVAPTWVFWTKEAALRWLEEEAEFPLVFKLKAGASSSNVVLVRNRAYAERLVRRMFGGGIMGAHIPGLQNVRWRDISFSNVARRYGGHVKRRMRGDELAPFEWLHRNYVLFQKFLPNNPFDTRIYVVGKRAFGERRFVRKNDFRASGSGKIDACKEAIDLSFVRHALDVSEKLGFQSMAYDFLYDQNRRPVVSEMSYTFPDYAMPEECEGYWDQQLRWHEGRYWPQYLILMDELKFPGLKQPDIPIKHDS